MNETYKTVAKYVLIVALLGGSFAAGRYTLAPKTIEVVKTVEVTKEVVKTVIQVVEKKVYVRGETRDVVREVVVIRSPDGTETTKITETDKTKTTEASSQESSSMATSVVYRDREVFVDRLKIVANEKDWHLGINVGAGARFIGAPLVPQLTFGARIERRIAGPFFVGLDVAAQVGIVPTAAPALQPPVTVTGSLVLGLGF